MNETIKMSVDPPAPQQTADSLPLIRASELAQYGFCQRAWWLGTVKRLPSRQQAALTRGTRTHHEHFHQVQVAVRWRQASFSLFGGGGVLLIIALIWLLLTFSG
jgi:hypothetical protein